jgi:hypothetical protein
MRLLGKLRGRPPAGAAADRRLTGAFKTNVARNGMQADEFVQDSHRSRIFGMTGTDRVSRAGVEAAPHAVAALPSYRLTRGRLCDVLHIGVAGLRADCSPWR